LQQSPQKEQKKRKELERKIEQEYVKRTTNSPDNPYNSQYGKLRNQSMSLKVNNCRQEHTFWKNGIEQVIPGYRDAEFTEKVILFIKELDLANMSEAERKLIFSKHLQKDKVTRTASSFVNKFLTKWDKWLYEQAKEYVEKYQEHLIA